MGKTYTEPVSGCHLQNATLKLQYGIVVEGLNPGTGLYSTLPSTFCASGVPTTSSDAGTGLIVGCTTYASTVSFGTDNAPAFQNAIRLMNRASASGKPQCVYFPAGNYLTSVVNTAGSNGTLLTMAQGYGCFLGDEHYHSNIFVIPNTAGDVFAWNDSNNNGSSGPFGNTQTFGDFSGHPNKAGSAFRYLTVIGDRGTTADQNALAFYGPTDSLLIDDIVISYMRGHAIVAGLPDANGAGNLTKSRISNIHISNSGDFGSGTTAAIAALDIGAAGGPGSGDIDLLNLRFFDNFGPNLWLHAGASATTNTKHVSIATLKAEESMVDSVAPPAGYPVGSDMVLFGDSGSTGTAGVSDLLCRNLQLVNQIPSYASLHVGGTAQAMPARMDCEFDITSNAYSRGLQVDACQQCAFRAIDNLVQDTQLQIGPSATCGPGSSIVAPGVTYDATANGAALTTCVDPAALGLVQFAGGRLLANGALGNVQPDPPVAQLVSVMNASGNATLTFGTPVAVNPALPLWTITRTGPSGAFTDTWDTAKNIVAAINNAASPNWAMRGQTYQLRICNKSNALETLVAPPGVSLTGATQVAAGSCQGFALNIVDASGSGSVIIAGQ